LSSRKTTDAENAKKKYPGHGWFAAAVRMYLWWEMQLKMSTDQVHVTRHMILKRQDDIGSSPLWLQGE